MLMLCALCVDVSKTGQIYDFFVKCGWVKTEGSVSKGTHDSHTHASLIYLFGNINSPVYLVLFLQ